MRQQVVFSWLRILAQRNRPLIGKNGHAATLGWEGLKRGFQAKVRGDGERRKLCGRNAGQFFEFVDEMSLIVIATLERYVRPIPALLACILRCVTKTQHAREMLGAQAGALKADSTELTRTKAGGIGERID